jgi:transposase InsO family protein
MHKNTKLLPYMRKAIYAAWINGQSITSLKKEYKVNRGTIYKVLERGKIRDFNNHLSINKRFKTIEYGLRKLSVTECKLQKKLDRLSIKRYEKQYPGQMVHFDTKRLPLLWGEGIRDKREHLHVAIDDYSRHLTADIFPDKGQCSSAIHLQEVIKTAPYNTEGVYSDNGSAYKGRYDHQFVAKCIENGLSQGFTKPRHPQTNGKAERVIRTLMEEWHIKGRFENREDRKKALQEYVYQYNHNREHKGIANQTPIQRITNYFTNLKSVYNAGHSYTIKTSFKSSIFCTK